MTSKSVSSAAGSIPSPRQLQMSRARMVPYPLMGLAFAALGWALHSEPGRAGVAGWVGLALGVAATPLALVQIVRPPVLLLDAEGFTERRVLGATRVRWDQVEEFIDGRLMHRVGPVNVPGPRVVWYLTPEDAVGVLKRGFGGLDVQHLAAMLNEYRQAFTK